MSYNNIKVKNLQMNQKKSGRFNENHPKEIGAQTKKENKEIYNICNKWISTYEDIDK